jgi:uncharacterized cupredoxin-like copper-binding protein
LVQQVSKCERTPLRTAAVLAALGLVMLSCGPDGPDGPDGGAARRPPTAADDMNMGAEHDLVGEGQSEEFEFGQPMEAAEATRVIEISAHDDFTFVPASVVVETGETVTFRVENVGVLDHDFTLGDSDRQDEHEAEMAEMAAMSDAGSMAMHEEPNAFGLASGEMKEMTWHFTQPGEILFGCHTPGHYAAGMFGSVTINA